LRAFEFDSCFPGNKKRFRFSTGSEILLAKEGKPSNHLLSLYGFHHGSGSNGLSGNLLLLLLLAGHESGGRKGEDSDLLHNYLLVLMLFDAPIRHELPDRLQAI
jgi:hypothetical protein